MLNFFISILATCNALKVKLGWRDNSLGQFRLCQKKNIISNRLIKIIMKDDIEKRAQTEEMITWRYTGGMIRAERLRAETAQQKKSYLIIHS